MTDEAPKRAVDWERVEADYRAGVLSLREIGAAHGVSHVAVGKRAKRDGWSRDLAAKIQAKADALVTKRTVTSQVTAETLVTERLLIEGSAEAIANVRLGHRKDISTARTLCLTLLSELTAVTEGRLTIEDLADILDKAENPDGNEARQKMLDKAREALSKATSLPSRAGTIKALSDSLKTLVTLEREAWGLKTDGAGDTPIDPPVINLGFANGGPGE